VSPDTPSADLKFEKDGYYWWIKATGVSADDSLPQEARVESIRVQTIEIGHALDAWTFDESWWDR
jgi:hypothetical protein